MKGINCRTLTFKKKCDKSKLHIVQKYKDIPRVLCTIHVFTFQFLQYCKEFYSLKRLKKYVMKIQDTGHLCQINIKTQILQVLNFRTI